MINRKKIYFSWKNSTVLISAYLYLLFLILFLLCDSFFKDNIPIFIFSILGVLVFIFINYSYKKNTGRIFDLYIITIWFMFLFNFGQCFAWAFNIHYEGEIGSTVLFRYFVPNSLDIVRAQLAFLMCIIVFHGTIIFFKNSKTKKMVSKEMISKERGTLFKASKLMALFIIPTEFYYTVTNYIQAKNYGYGSLYYGELAEQGSKILTVLNYSFFPCLVGLLVGSNYRKNIRQLVYLVFFIYVLLNLLLGDRGSWIYTLFILIWMHHTYYVKISKKNFFIFIIVSFLLLYLVFAIVSVRNQGINFNSVVNALSSSTTNPIISALFEMGGSMGINIIVIRDNIKYPLGNSYLLSLLGAISTRIPKIFDINYITLTRWFSQEYLGIAWGAAFTIFAEGIVNLGVYFAPLIFVLYGILLKKVLLLKRNSYLSPIRIYIYLSIVSFFLNMIRNTMHDFIRGVFFGILPLLILVRIIKEFNRRK